MKGEGGGGITIYNVLLFYVVFLLFMGFLGTLAGVNIVQVGGNPNNIPIPANTLDLVGLFNFFIALLSTNSTFQIISIIFVTPFVVLLGYAILQLIRGTG
jgi:hypothetical protein